MAIRDGQLAGYLVGRVLDPFRGKRSIYCPEWANATHEEEASSIFQQMYTHLSARWVANGCFQHVITVLAHQPELISTLHWLGFGMMAVDAMRDLNPILGSKSDVEIRQAGVREIEQIMALGSRLQRYLAAAPTFLAFTERYTSAYHEQGVAQPTNVLWIAYQDAKAVAYMELGGANPKAAYIIGDDRTTSVTAAFTQADARGGGIGTALLSRALEWAREAGYTCCAVDFEPENVLGARFWTRHFQPVCYSLARQVDARVAWANPSRDIRDVW